MARLETELLYLCDFALTSQEGKLSIIGIFDRMFVTAVPSAYSRFFMVGIVSGEPDAEIDLTLSITTPSGKDVLEPKTLRVKLGGNGKSNIITDMVNFPLPEVGEYTVALQAEGKTIGSSKFAVMKVAGNDGNREKLPN